MDVQKEKIAALLRTLGVEDEHVQIYLSLIEYGEMTTLELSRATNISRTQIYRLLEEMKKLALVEEVVDAKRMKTRAVGVEGLERLVKEQEEKVKKVNALLPEITSLLTGAAGLREQNTKVLFYRGREGIKQIVWHVLQAKGEVLGYTYIDVDSAMGREMAEDWRQEVVRRGIHFRDITSDPQVFEHSQNTNVAGYVKFCHTRYLPKEKLTIDHQVDIYNNVIALYSWKEGDVFGVEIYNPTIVNLQKQVFNLLWQMTKRRLR